MNDREYSNAAAIVGTCTEMVKVLGDEVRQSSVQHRREIEDLERRHQRDIGRMLLAVFGLALVMAMQSVAMVGMFRFALAKLL